MIDPTFAHALPPIAAPDRVTALLDELTRLHGLARKWEWSGSESEMRVDIDENAGMARDLAEILPYLESALSEAGLVIVDLSVEVAGLRTRCGVTL